MNNVKGLTDAGSASTIYAADLAASVFITGQFGYTHKDPERVYKL